METPTLEAIEARKLLLSGQAPAHLRVNGDLDLSHEVSLTVLPEGLNVGRLVLDHCPALKALPAGLHCISLSACGTPLTELPDDLHVTSRLDLSDCKLLTHVPKGFAVDTLILRGCTALEELPEQMHVFVLDMSGCINVQRFPTSGPEQMARLNAQGCTRLTALPSWLKRVGQLDVSGCARLHELPEGLHVVTWLDLAHTPLRQLPASLQGVSLRWRGVAVNERIVFHPETITTQQVLEERNVERRRVLLERLGYERFLAETQARVLHRDRDAGGERRLLYVPLQNDEPLVCLEVRCPSTGRRYLIRVPPTMRQCHQAAAWIAGFDNPEHYRPLVET
jgi:hypothetical protein